MTFACTDFKLRTFARRRLAITLVELTLVLAVAAIAIAVGVRAYSNAQLASRVDMQIQQISTVRAAILTLYPDQDYAGLYMTKLLNSLPQSMMNADKTEGLNPFGGTFFADRLNYGDGTDNAFTISLSNVPKAACQRLATFDLTPGAVRLYIGDKNLNYHQTAAARATPQEAQSFCSDSGALSWWFHE